MPPRLQPLSLATATVLLSLTPLLPNHLGSVALAQTQTAQNRKARANQLYQQGMQLSDQAALKKFQKALAIYRGIDDKAGEANALIAIGDIYRYRNEDSQAKQVYQQAISLYKNAGDRKNELDSLFLLGNYLAQQNPQEALEIYQQALVLIKALGNNPLQEISLRHWQGVSLGILEGDTLERIAGIYFKQRQYPQALESYQQSLAIYKIGGADINVASILQDIGAAYKELGQYPQALESFQQALFLHQEGDDYPEVEIDILINLGEASLGLQESAQAEKFFEQAVAASQNIPLGGKRDIKAESDTLIKIGEVYLQSSQTQAERFFERATAVYQTQGDHIGEGRTLNNIGLAYRRQGQYPQAMQVYQQALSMLRKVGDKEGERAALYNIGCLHYKSGQYLKALEFYQQALAISQDEDVLSAIGQVYDSLGQPDKARKFYRQDLRL